MSAGEVRAGAAAGPAGLAALASVTLDGRQLGDLELILSGAFAPLTGFMTSAQAGAVAEHAGLADGGAFPVPVTLAVPAAAAPPGTARLALADPEGTPLGVLDITERTDLPAADGRPGDSPLIRLAGPVTGVRAPEHGPFRRLMLLPRDVRAELDGKLALALITQAPVHSRQIGQLRHLAGQLGARLLLMPMVAEPAEVVTAPESLVRAVLAAAAALPAGTLVVPVPLASRPPAAGVSPAGELAARAAVAAAYGATHLMADGALAPGAGPSPVIPVLSGGDWAYDPRADVWRPISLIEAGAEQEEMSAGELGDLLDAGADVPGWFTPAAVARELRRARPPRSRRGLVLFLTGLSGSGKSTLAGDLRDQLSERGDRRVSLLDGDLVRQLLSAGLTFSREDRDLNIARIGYVAAEVARHGGIAICAPIAPYAAARARVREMVSQVGDFLLIHVATPLEVCEARDRKGLYAKARAGIIGQFTGISDPYEEPDDAEFVVDTSVLARREAASAVLAMLAGGGWLAAEPG